MIEKIFVPYNIAVALKGIGFNEECLASASKDWTPYIPSKGGRYRNSTREEGDYTVACPTWDQAFNWAREEFKIHAEVSIDIESKWFYNLYNLSGKRNSEIHLVEDTFDTYEMAREACLEHLIDAIKNVQK